MSDQHPTRDTMSIEEAMISNMWEIAAIVELLEQKGLCTKQDSPPSSTSYVCPPMLPNSSYARP